MSPTGTTLREHLPRVVVKFDKFGFAATAVIHDREGRPVFDIAQFANLRSVTGYVKGGEFPTVTLELDAFPEFGVLEGE